MTLEIEKATSTGLCFGVRRAINILEKVARDRGKIETLGSVVHNQQVLQRLESIGVRIAMDVDDIHDSVVAISSHGVSPQVENQIRERHIDIINATCPFVHRAQIAARRLAESGFFVVIYGDADHPEVKGILGWAGGQGKATLDGSFLGSLDRIPRRLGVLSQTTQIPTDFKEFAKGLIDSAFGKDSEMRIIDTICHDIRERQAAALRLAKKVDLMIVIGDHNSANTNRLAELCSTITRAHLVETPDEIQTCWFESQSHVGITAGASTDEPTINAIVARLEAIARS